MNSRNPTNKQPAIHRIGHGYDVHGFTTGDHILLGGVRIPHSHAFKAHSDGDVLVHAICDALLGAIGGGDIGTHFPDSDNTYQNVDSFRLLEHVYTMVREKNYALGNLDATIIAQEPRITPHVPRIRTNLARALDVSEDRVNIKATTTEKLGYIGRGEGVAVHSVVILCSNRSQ